MSHHTQRFQTQGVSLSTSCDDIERDVENQRNSTRTALRAAAEPVVSYPDSIALLEEQGRTDDLPKLDILVTGIARDVDHFSEEDKRLSDEFEHLRTTRPKKKAHMARYFNQVAAVGHRYIELNERILGTVSKLTDDYTDIINPEVAQQVRELEQQAEAQS